MRETEAIASVANSANEHDTSGEALQLEPGSYRDRNGVVFYRDGEVFRGISAKALANWERLSAASFFRELIAQGSIVETAGPRPNSRRSSAAAGLPCSSMPGSRSCPTPMNGPSAC